MSSGLPGSPRVIVVGTSGAGKSSFAAELASRLGVPRIEMDVLFWDRNWQPKPKEQFVALVRDATDGDAWVVDGNYGSVRDHVWPKANLIIWLNYGLPLVFWRGLKRTLHRIVTGRELWHGNRESLHRAFFTRDSILLWILSTHRRRTAEFDELRRSSSFAAAWLEFRHPRQAAAWLDALPNAPDERAALREDVRRLE